MRNRNWKTVSALMAGAMMASPALAKTEALTHFTLIDGT
ncbi:MAG: hypothetical protein JWN66_1487, partial [Sphingomonas bacterium]|nr:hypothetical protein [Sphingomonas bacterium]